MIVIAYIFFIGILNAYNANSDEVFNEYGLNLWSELPEGEFDAIVKAVAHKEFDMVKFENNIVYSILY
ncbi:hypothetical protein AGMMS49574_28750 [Bacteroidia bacterium]|nr:hypothetical protein AGMMS49574_28750 [Bacteroidia bacterium]